LLSHENPPSKDVNKIGKNLVFKSDQVLGRFLKCTILPIPLDIGVSSARAVPLQTPLRNQ
jgi:hypothetical protein